jgi:hypothetical protein
LKYIVAPSALNVGSASRAVVLITGPMFVGPTCPAPSSASTSAAHNKSALTDPGPDRAFPSAVPSNFAPPWSRTDM